VLPYQLFMGRNDALKTCAGYVKNFGEEYGLKVVDYWLTLYNITKKIQAIDPTTTIIGADRVHPGPVGHFIMGYTFLKATQVQPCISEIVINANKENAKIKLALNCNVSHVHSTEHVISFDCIEKSLPFPVMKDAEEALKLVPFNEDLNREVLKISNLRPGMYRLSIDKIIIGYYSDKELGKGVNLSENPKTPQYIQALKVLSLFQEFWKLESSTRWLRAIEIGRLGSKKSYSLSDGENYFNTLIKRNTDTTKAAYKDAISLRTTYLDSKTNESEMLVKMEKLHDLIYQINQPIVHKYEIIKE
jgi:hypothetical protein